MFHNIHQSITIPHPAPSYQHIINSYHSTHHSTSALHVSTHVIIVISNHFKRRTAEWIKIQCDAHTA